MQTKSREQKTKDFKSRGSSDVILPEGLQDMQTAADFICSAQIATLTKAERDELKLLQQEKEYIEHYDFQSVLGQGAFCTVYQAKDR